MILCSQISLEAKVFNNELSGNYTKDILIYLPFDNTFDNDEFDQWNSIDLKYMYTFSKFIYFGVSISYNSMSFTRDFEDNSVADSSFNINYFSFHFYTKQYFSNPNLLTGFASFDFGISLGEVRHDQYFLTGSSDIGLNIPLNTNYKLNPSVGVMLITNDHSSILLNIGIELIHTF